jgi:hypothetical protein
MFGAWMRILHAVPGSVLWLLADNDTARDNMLRAADAHGVARRAADLCAARVAARVPGAFPLADLMLDTFPFNAGTTASDALWMGLPILTRAGRTYISRMAGSLLTAVGLPDLITDNLADYEKLAITLGREPARVASLQALPGRTRPQRRRCSTCRRSCATSKPSSNAWPWPRQGAGGRPGMAEGDEPPRTPRCKARPSRRPAGCAAPCVRPRLGHGQRCPGARHQLADAAPRPRTHARIAAGRPAGERTAWGRPGACVPCARPVSAPAWCSAASANCTSLLLPAVLLLKEGDACIVVARHAADPQRYDIVMPGREHHACTASEAELEAEYTGVALVATPEACAAAQPATRCWRASPAATGCGARCGASCRTTARPCWRRCSATC